MRRWPRRMETQGAMRRARVTRGPAGRAAIPPRSSTCATSWAGAAKAGPRQVAAVPTSLHWAPSANTPSSCRWWLSSSRTRSCCSPCCRRSGRTIRRSSSSSTTTSRSSWSSCSSLSPQSKLSSPRPSLRARARAARAARPRRRMSSKSLPRNGRPSEGSKLWASHASACSRPTSHVTRMRRSPPTTSSITATTTTNELL
mmetsp:Transcript_15772/g.42396  ORF Transcript_15772/g.42396 Transcript_15772/m.42396 type:complete len:200 (-) Transcript_15772:533-1132(-)